LITLQVANNSNFPKNCRIICLEPVKIYFNNLEKNIKILNKSIDVSLYNFGLNDVGNSNATAWRSNRNATATQHVNLSLDPIKKLKSEIIEIIEVDYFVENFLNCLPDEVLTIKSDTDGSDIVIFNLFLSTSVSTKIRCYVLEIILINLDDKDLDIFIKNCGQFTQWTLKLSNNEIIKSKKLILNLFSSERNLRGDLFLIK
jgi:FkbM family methyltransferase